MATDSITPDFIDIPVHRNDTSIREIPISKKIYDHFQWLASQYLSTYIIHIGTNIIESDFALVDIVSKNYAVDNRLKVYTILYNFEPQHQELSLYSMIDYEINTSNYSGSPYDGSSLNPFKFSIPRISKRQIWNNLKITIDPLYDIKCKTQLTCVDGMILCETCKEVWD